MYGLGGVPSADSHQPSQSLLSPDGNAGALFFQTPLISIKPAAESAAAHRAVALGVVHYDPGFPRRGRPGLGYHSGRALASSRMSTTAAIQELVGHVSLSTTQGYTQVDRAYLLKAYELAHSGA